MGKFKKYLGRSVSVLAVSSLLATGVVTSAFAAVGGAGSSGSGGGGGGSLAGVEYVHWIGPGTLEQARAGIVKNSGKGKLGYINVNTGAGGYGYDEFGSVCQSALNKVGSGGKIVSVAVSIARVHTSMGQKIWGLFTTNRGAFISGIENTAISRTNSTFSTKNKYKAGLATSINAVFNSNIDASPRVVCVAASASDISTQIDYSFSKSYNKTVTNDFNAVYSENISLNKQIMAKGSSSGWTDQTKAQLTNYGTAVESVIKTYGSKKTLTAAEKNTIKTKLENAIKKDKDTPKNLTINMTNTNQKAFADGGVVNVIKNQQTRKINLSDNRTGEINFTNCSKGKKTEAQKKANELFKKDNMTIGEINAAITTIKTTYGCSASNPTGKTTLTMTSPDPKTAKPVAFWQMISVHCNKEGFEKLYNSVDGATIIDTGDVSKGISAVMHSKQYEKAPSKLDFGAAGTESGNVAFYDKECPFECTADPTTASASKNGAKNNVVNNIGAKFTTTEISNLYGAKSGGVNGNLLTFFRDNVEKVIDVDLWYPVAGGNGVVNYNGKKAVTTTITRSADGTPSLTGAEGGKFTMNAISGSTKTQLFTGSGNPKTQKNWNTATDSTSVSEILKGQYTKFDVAASWASEAGKPQVLNFKWEFNPPVSTVIPATSIGFNANNSKNVGTTKTVSRNIEGKCYANFGTEKSNNTVDLFQEATGTGTTNTLDVGPIGNNKGSDVSTNLIINFVRATTE